MIKPFYLDLSEQEIENIQVKLGDILRSGQLILGECTNAFESEFAHYVGSKYAVSLNSCTSALQALLILRGAKHRKVAVPTNTNFASVAAIIREGGIPIFMDMTLDYFSPDLDILQHTYSKNPDLAGVLWVHIGGIITPDFCEIAEYCKEKGLFLIEDSAHAHGSTFSGVKAGNFGDGGAYSFFPTKVMTTIEGGIVTTNSSEDAKMIRSIRNQGKRAGNYGGLHYDLGNSWRMSEIEAYIGLVQLQKLDKMISHRAKVIDQIVPVLEDCGVNYCSVEHMTQASLYKFIIQLNDHLSHESIKTSFKQEDIVLGGGVYHVPCHQQPVFEKLKFDRSDLQTSEKYCPQHVCIPVHSGLTDMDVRKMISAIKKYLV